MPAGRFSRHLLCQTHMDSMGRLYLADRTRYRYRELPDNRFHQVAEGDSLYVLAATYFEGLDRPSGMFWVIADFQPTPIFDTTVPLEIGRVLVIPSMRTLTEEILNPNRQDDLEG
jgi:hypothetical protein